MPTRDFSRTRTWLFPPTLDELVSPDHGARFIATVVDSLDRVAWAEMGISYDGNPRGTPGYDVRVLLGAWLYGFMTGIRSTRKLEAACRDSIGFLWLTGWQRPDHNTLWRFYQEHRTRMRALLKRTVRAAVTLDLVDIALQALDGTKVAGNAAKDRTFDAKGLDELETRLEAAIADLEAQNSGDPDVRMPNLPGRLAKAETLKEQVQAAMKQLQEEEGRKRVNLTDADAGLVKGRQGVVAGYNAQAMVSLVGAGKETGLLITAADVVTDPEDHGQLVPMVKAAREMVGPVESTLADGGFHSGANLEACAALGQQV